MNIFLWIVASLLALFVAAAGFMKTLRPIEEIRKMPWAAKMPAAKIRLIGIAELLGAIGLIAPQATGILPILTPIAAVCLAVLMIGAARTHQKINDPRSSIITTIALGIALLILAAGRFSGIAG